MKLPNNEVGISDILQWRDCAMRMAFGMRRHTEGDPAESWSPANAYGSAVHDGIHAIEEGAAPEEAAQQAFARFAQWLEPADLTLLVHDLDTYMERDMLGVRTIVAEEDYRFPLFERDGVTYYFRFRLDRLYQRLDDESQFIHVDYKTSKWAKSQSQVDEDLQMWAYNVGIHKLIEDLYPEVEEPSVTQFYDQLRYGQLDTRKSAAQREEMERWLVAAVTAILDDEEPDPTFNEFCPWCPLKIDCPVIQHGLTDWALTRIAALAPREPKLKKDGSPSKVLGAPKLDPERFTEYVDVLPEVKRAKQVLEAFEETVRDAMRDLPLDRLATLESREAPSGYERATRTRRGFSSTGVERAFEMVGAELFHMVNLSAAAIERFYGKEDPRTAALVELAEPRGGYEVVVPRRET